jgi:hypothetical protein
MRLGWLWLQRESSGLRPETLSLILSNMSILLEAARDKPLGLWDLSGTSPFTDRSGYGSAASLAGTIRRHASLGNGLGSAAVVTNAARAQFGFTEFTQGREQRSFSLEAIVRPIQQSGTVVTNLSTNPRFVTAASPQANNSYWTVAQNVAITDHPQGITTATRVHKNATDPNNSFIASLYNVDNMGNTTTARGLGIWVMTPHSGYAANWQGQGQSPIPLTANVWQFIKNPNVQTAWAAFEVRTVGGTVAPINDAVFLTGVIAIAGDQPQEFFDGTTDGGTWTGTTNQSTSTTLRSSWEHQILGHLDTYDGLVLKGDTLSFLTKYTNTGESRASYDLGTLRNIVVLGVHTKKKNQLFVNGELVAESEISDEQQADTYLTPGTTLYSGQTQSGNSLAQALVAVYNYPVSSTAARRHAVIARRTSNPSTVAEQFGGTRVILPGTSGNTYMDYLIDEDHEWKDGRMLNVEAKDGILTPTADSGMSLPGYWLGSVPLGATTATSIYGVALTWEGIGATVEASLDGATWQPVVKGQFVPQIASGYNPQDKVLHVRISFKGFAEDDPSYVANFRAVGHLTANEVTEGRNVTKVAKPVLGRYFHHIDYADDWGITTGPTAGFIRVGAPDAQAPTVGPGTIEIWAKMVTPAISGDLALIDAREAYNNALGQPTMTRNYPNPYGRQGVLYVNGIASTSYAPAVGEWALIHLVSSAAIPLGEITIGGRYYFSGAEANDTWQIGHVAIYDRQLTAAESKAIYDTYTGVPTLRVGDTSIIAASVPGNGASIYAHDWSIQSAG